MKQVIVLFEIVGTGNPLVAPPTFAMAVIDESMVEEISTIASKGGGERDAKADLTWVGGVALWGTELHISNSGFWFSAETGSLETVETRVEYLDNFIVAFKNAKNGDVLEVGSDVLLEMFIEAHSSTRVVIEALAIDEHGEAPAYARIQDGGSLLEELREVRSVLQENEIDQGRRSWELSWQDIGLRLSGHHLVVEPSGNFWFVAGVKAANYDVETRLMSVSALALQLAQTQPGDAVYLCDPSNLEELKADYAEGTELNAA